MRIRGVRSPQLSNCPVAAETALTGNGLTQNFQVPCVRDFSEIVGPELQPYPPQLLTENRFPVTESTGHEIIGQLANYGSTASVIELSSRNSTESLRVLLDAKQRGFVDAQTRAISIEHNIWSGNTGDVIVVRQVVEFSASGVVLTTSQAAFLTPNDLIVAGRATDADWAQFCIELLLCFLVLFYVYEEFYELRENGLGVYFSDAWNVLDWTNMVLLSAAIAMRFIVYSQAAGLASDDFAERETQG